MEISLISQYIGGELSTELDKIIKAFVGQHHQYHCKCVIDEEFKNVHKIMDKKIGAGKKHRLHGHNIDFINKKFHGKERQAAYIHLLGDFVADVLPIIFYNVLKEMKINKITPPCYLTYNDNNSWDIKESAKNEMIITLSNGLVTSLKSTNRKK